MARGLRLKRKKTLAENGGLLIPELFDRFFGGRDRVIGHPRRKKDLHRMRISGKPLRYAMETFGVCYGPDFALCLQEVKGVLEIMGSLHDLDVACQKIDEHLLELRLLNRTMPARRDHYPLGLLRKLLKDTRAERAKDFEDFSRTLRRWERSGFRNRLVKSLAPRQANIRRRSTQ